MNKNIFEYTVFLFIAQIARLAGIKRQKYLAVIIAHIFYYILKIRKKVVLNNLRMAFPDLTHDELNKLAYKNYLSFAISILEILVMPYISKKTLHEIVDVVNIDLVKEKYSEGRGVILFTAHFGNWELGAVSASSQLGIPFMVLAKPQRNPYITKWLKKNRERFGSKEILLGLSVRDIYVAIKQKGIVGIVGDQRGPKDGPRVKYFGQETATFLGVGSIALKTKTPVIMSMMVRQPSGIYKGYFDEIPTDDLPGEGDEKIINFNQRYMNLLEKYVRANPEQWLWMHKIWKY